MLSAVEDAVRTIKRIKKQKNKKKTKLKEDEQKKPEEPVFA